MDYYVDRGVRSLAGEAFSDLESSIALNMCTPYLILTMRTYFLGFFEDKKTEVQSGYMIYLR